MHSGIDANREMIEAFKAFLDDNTLFCLPAEITENGKEIGPLEPIPFPSLNDSQHEDDAQFFNALPALEPLLERETQSRKANNAWGNSQNKEPVYLILRRASNADINSHDLIFLAYINDNECPIQRKMMYSSSHRNLLHTLGNNRFAMIIHASMQKEVLDKDIWEGRWKDKNVHGTESHQKNQEDVMNDDELQRAAISKAEEEERALGARRPWDIGLVGSVADVSFEDIKMIKFDRKDLEPLQAVENGKLVAFTLDEQSNLKLISTAENVDPESVPKWISKDTPQYTFYYRANPTDENSQNEPNTPEVIFIYSKPDGVDIRTGVRHASAKPSMIKIAELLGLKIKRSIENGGPEDITVYALAGTTPPQPKVGFARARKPQKKKT
ncbi:Twinfilin-1 [Onygenales sp. PD_12]|nr:Twinfilin-1 [Onygenales sp. PD_12]